MCMKQYVLTYITEASSKNNHRFNTLHGAGFKWLKLVFRACVAPSHASTDVLLLKDLHLAN